MYLVGAVPCLIAGFLLLNILSLRGEGLLRIVLGAFLLLAALIHVMKPRPRDTFSPPSAQIAVGGLAGFIGGLFATAGPPLVYLLYRQPLAIAQIRATLLTVFVFLTTFRIIVATVHGSVTQHEGFLLLLGLPTVMIFTFLGRRWPLPFNDIAMRRFAFILLALLGLALIIR
jgi:uncharacterized membrane protein YfcA